jgi:hypothetical protein
MDKLVIDAIKDKYGFTVVSSKDLYSYYGGVSEITTDKGEVFIFKYRGNVGESGLLHHEAVVEFCNFVEENITEFVTQKYIPNLVGEYFTYLWNRDYCYIVEKREINKKTYITPREQRFVGQLMRIFHTKLKDFKHPGLIGTEYMAGFGQAELNCLAQNYKLEEYEPFIKPFDYEEEGLETTLLHGDWHESNMSFSKPPFLFDLDTLSRGTRLEEIARSVTHWNFGGKPKKELFENMVKGYGDLTQKEIDLAIKVMISTSYKKYAMFMLHKDLDHANGYKYLAEYLKREFNLE